MTMIILSGVGINIFGLFVLNPALFAFIVTGLTFAGLNFIEYKRID